MFEIEPLKPNHELYELENVTITAHITGNDYEEDMIINSSKTI